VGKLALGLYHFNAHWGAESRSAQRHCTEALAPFLRVLKRHPDWRVSIDIAGSGLELLNEHYPVQTRRLRALVENGQVELISTMYTPSLWVAFPRSDLIRSIERNRQCLSKLGFPAGRLFFAQEGLFGESVHTLTEYFDAAICKDDYLNYFYDT
jgi:hypothetical protein